MVKYAFICPIKNCYRISRIIWDFMILIQRLGKTRVKKSAIAFRLKWETVRFKNWTTWLVRSHLFVSLILMMKESSTWRQVLVPIIPGQGEQMVTYRCLQSDWNYILRGEPAISGWTRNHLPLYRRSNPGSLYQKGDESNSLSGDILEQWFSTWACQGLY